MRKLLGIFLVLLSPIIFAQTYYVDATLGSDANPGTKAQPFQTIAHVDGISADTIYLKRGEIWRERWSLLQSGTSDEYYYIGAYGDENDYPEIRGSIQMTGWEAVDTLTNVWRCGIQVNNPYDYEQAELWVIDLDGNVHWTHHRYSNPNTWPNDDSSALQDLVVDDPNDDRPMDLKCTYLGNNSGGGYSVGYIFMYSATDPDTRFSSVECPIRSEGIYWNDRQYVHIDSLQIRFVTKSTIGELYGTASGQIFGHKVTRCDLGYSGIKDGPNMYGIENKASNSYFGYNKIHNSGRRNISLTMYSTTPIIYQDSVIIEHNQLYEGYHTTGLDCNIVGGHTIQNIIFRNNHVYNDTTRILDLNSTATRREGDPNSMTMFVANQSSQVGTVRRVFIVGNVFYSHTSSGINLENVREIYIYNNTFYGQNKTLDGTRAFIYYAGASTDSIHVGNNIYFNDAWKNTVGVTSLAALKIDLNNITDGADWNDGNLYYDEQVSDRAITVNYAPQHYTFSQLTEWIEDYGFDVNAIINQDPLLVDIKNMDMQLSTGSPAIGAGIALPSIVSSIYTSDINGNSVSSTAPDIGAFQYTEPDPTPTQRGKALRFGKTMKFNGKLITF